MQRAFATDEIDFMPTERERVVRYCRRYTRDPHVAEDLAQQTLLEAWQHLGSLRQPESRLSWLVGIARNVCYRWARTTSRERARMVGQFDDHVLHSHFDTSLIADDVIIDTELERHDLARLLDQALALLPADTRDALMLRYIEALPQAEIAARLGATGGAIEARLHRGRLALRRLLTTRFREDAVAFGLIRAGDADWHTTRIWCPFCGMYRVQALRSATTFSLHCPGCSPNGHLAHGGADEDGLFDGVTSFKPVFTRLIQHAGVWLTNANQTGQAGCPGCGQPRPLVPGMGATYIDGDASLMAISGVHIHCPACDRTTSHSLAGYALSLPEARRFWRDHPRMRLRPERTINAHGVPAVVLGFEAVTTESARIDIVVGRDRFQVLGSHLHATA